MVFEKQFPNKVQHADGQKSQLKVRQTFRITIKARKI